MANLTSELPRDVLLFSTADWDNPFWTNKQHMAVKLAERGYRVLYVESLGLRKPRVHGRDIARIFRRLRKAVFGLRVVRDNIWVLSPLVVPVHSNRLVRVLNKRMLSLQLHINMWRLGFKRPIIWTYNPLFFELFKPSHTSLLVYHCVDDLTAAPGMPVEAIASAERDLVGKADLVFTTNTQLQATRAKWNPQNTHYFSNVADFTHFSRALNDSSLPTDLHDIPTPRIGFIGAISQYKVDFGLIGKIADIKKDWHWVLIGQVGEGQPETSVELLHKPNIHMLGPKAYQVLPDYLHGFDIATLPCNINDYTVSMFPMKFFEYLAAGVPVVSTRIPALLEYADVCSIADTAEEFVAAIQTILDGGGPDKQRGLELARMHTWDTRLDKMEKILKEKWTVKQHSNKHQ